MGIPNPGIPESRIPWDPMGSHWDPGIPYEDTLAYKGHISVRRKMLNFGIQRLFLLIEEWAIIDLKQPISPDTSSQMT